MVDSARGFAAQPLDYLIRQHTEHGDMFAMRMAGVPTVFCGGAGGPAALFQAEPGHLEIYNTGLVHDLFRRAVFNLRGEEHLQARRMLLAGLVGPPLRRYATRALRLAQSHAERWSAAPGFDLYQSARDLTMDVCAQVILGVRPHERDHQALNRLFDVFVRGTDAPSARRYASPAYWRGRRAAAELRALFQRRLGAGPDPSRGDVLSHLAEYVDQHGMDPASLPDHLLALLIATRETTASLLTWLLVELAHDSPLAEAIGAEARTLCAEPDLLVDREAAPSLRAAVLEAERLHSPNTISLRIVVADCSIGGYEVPKGWRAAYSPAANHLMPQLYDSPDQFRSDRFAGKRGHSVSSLLTFGRGLHACPGKQFAELVVLATVTATYAHHRLAVLGGVPTVLRHLPVKAPTTPLPALLTTAGR
ncbi:hypothetical protein CgIS1_18095 [Frankia sp. CgS1]|nr:hypothetical protein CgIS1_18095 [Frankia sp. CgIS1]